MWQFPIPETAIGAMLVETASQRNVKPSKRKVSNLRIRVFKARSSYSLPPLRIPASSIERMNGRVSSAN